MIVDDQEAEVIIFDNNGFFPVQRLYAMLLNYPHMNEDLSLYSDFIRHTSIIWVGRR